MMHREDPRVSPPPLLDDPELGQLLREATLEYQSGSDEPAAFRRLSVRIARSAPNDGWAKGRWPVLVVALGAAGVWWGVSLQRDGALDRIESIAPTSELPRRERDEPAPAESPAASHASAEEPAEIDSAPALGTSKSLKAVKAPERLPTREREPEGASQSADPPKPEPVDCLDLARQGNPKGAERCFSERADGTGLEAEMALFEVARLRVDVLGDAEGGLTALRQYGERFPRGSLRREADMFRVELLARLGRGPEALSASDELLRGAAGAERAGDLYLLRGNVYRQSSNDPAAAEREYARAEALGGAAGVQASYLRGLCFEALGNSAAAIESYRRYTSVAGRPQARDALARIERLEQQKRAPGPGALP